MRPPMDTLQSAVMVRAPIAAARAKRASRSHRSLSTRGASLAACPTHPHHAPSVPHFAIDGCRLRLLTRGQALRAARCNKS